MTHYEYRMIAGIVWSATHALAKLVATLWHVSVCRASGDAETSVTLYKQANELLDMIHERYEHYTRAGED